MDTAILVILIVVLVLNAWLVVDSIRRRRR